MKLFVTILFALAMLCLSASANSYEDDYAIHKENREMNVAQAREAQAREAQARESLQRQKAAFSSSSDDEIIVDERTDSNIPEEPSLVITFVEGEGGGG